MARSAGAGKEHDLPVRARDGPECVGAQPGACAARACRHGQVYYVLEGQGLFLLETGDVPMQAGVLMVAPEGVPHGIRNTGTGRLLVLTIARAGPRGLKSQPPGKVGRR